MKRPRANARFAKRAEGLRKTSRYFHPGPRVAGGNRVTLDSMKIAVAEGTQSEAGEAELALPGNSKPFRGKVLSYYQFSASYTTHP